MGPELSRFPTRFRGKIPGWQSYPVGAQLISSELADVPQAQSFGIDFHSKYETLETRGEPYSILTVSYTGHRSQFRRSGWHIEVRPVPRALKDTVKQALTVDFFPRIRQWLGEYADLDSRYGTHSLSVVLDTKGETLLKLEEYHTRGEALSN